MATIQQVVDEWTNRRNNPQNTWNKSYPNMQLVIQYDGLIIGSGVRNGKKEDWASMKLDQHKTSSGAKWENVGNCGDGNNTACYYFSEFDNRIEVGIRIGKVIANGYPSGAQGLLNAMQSNRQMLNANNKYINNWEEDITQYGTVRLKLVIDKTQNQAFICDAMEDLIIITQGSIGVIP